MKSGQRDLHDSPLKRRLSISYEELETLHESIKDSVLEELRAELGVNPDQKPLKNNNLNQRPLKNNNLNQNSSSHNSLNQNPLNHNSLDKKSLNNNSLDKKPSNNNSLDKKPSNNNSLDKKPLKQKYSSNPSLNPQALKASILSEIRNELLGGGALSSPEVLKTSILNELRMELGGQRPSGAEQKLKEMKVLNDGLLRELLDQKTVVKKLGERVSQLSEKLDKLENKALPVKPPMLEDSLDLPPLSRKPGRRGDVHRRAVPGRERVEVREVPAPLPGSSTKVKLKIEDEFPESGTVEKPETKCEYIIAESGELKARQVPKGSSEKAQDRKCEFIVAEQPSRPAKENETVVRRDNEDVEIITCKRKMLNTQ